MLLFTELDGELTLEEEQLKQKTQERIQQIMEMPEEDFPYLPPINRRSMPTASLEPAEIKIPRFEIKIPWVPIRIRI